MGDGVSLGHGKDFFAIAALLDLPRGLVKLIGELTVYTSGGPVVGSTEVCNHMVPRVTAPHCGCFRSSASLRTQAWPAIEYVSGEESLRPKSDYIVFSFVEYAFTDALKYVMAPGSSHGAEGDGGTAPRAVTGPSATQCVVSLLPVTYCFPPKGCL